MEHVPTDVTPGMRMNWRRHMAVKLVLALIVLVFVFWAGTLYGQTHGARGMMMRGGAPAGAWNGANGAARTGAPNRPAGGMRGGMASTTTVSPAVPMQPAQ